MAQLTVIAGPMKSRKSKLLEAECERAHFANLPILCIKPAIDNRTSGKIATRELQADGTVLLLERRDAIDITGPEHLDQIISSHRFELMVADEVQFFPAGAAPAPGEPAEFGWFARRIDRLLDERCKSNLQIFCAGLDLDYRRRPFGAMMELLSLADLVIKTEGVCMNPKCHNMNARFSYRKTASKEQIVVGDADDYEVRCRFCHEYF